MKPEVLRKKHPKFVYESCGYGVVNGNLKTFFVFKIEPDIYFRPEIIIRNIREARLKEIGDGALDNFVFHLGLMEMPSYWKAACSPEIVIEAGALNRKQISWWKDLIIKGLGQFFYENKIDWRAPGFLKIKCAGTGVVQAKFPKLNLSRRYLVPVSGGKDSIVTLEGLKKQKKEINAFLLNPNQAAKDTCQAAGIKNPVIVERCIDLALLKLNSEGYLNGHTPFTAVLSFLAVFCAVLFDYRYVTFSNEKSANEGNLKYLGGTVNHQYSKSSRFEKKFKDYCRNYLTREVDYFSFLRKYTELEIAEMFSKYPKYFPFFLSCNRAGKKGERWCLDCPKCLFVYLTLYPYLKKEQLRGIFGQDLFENKKLLPVMKELLGQGRHKPFECVGTYRESRLAAKLSLKKALRQVQGKPVPFLLTKL